jgi:hypothetical protein
MGAPQAALGDALTREELLMKLGAARQRAPTASPSDGSSNGTAGASTGVAFRNAEIAHALSLYQSQIEQQLMASVGAMQSASV